jgi:predicted TPR repeat methyltransferase
MTTSQRRRLRAADFDALYAESEDPWQFASSDYEAAKYDATVAALEGRHFARALEVGCSIGVLTERLAPLADELLAIDVSAPAVERARRRLAGRPHVRVEQAEIPEGFPPGPWELVVCSEVLYYLDPPAFDATVAAIEAATAPGGALLAVHWRPATRTYPLRGDEVHALLRTRLGWPVGHHAETEKYVLDRFDRPA